MSELRTGQEQRRLNEKERKLCIFLVIIHVIINVSIWSIWGFNFNSENIPFFIIIFVSSLIIMIFLFYYLDKKMLEKEILRGHYRGTGRGIM